LSNSNKISAVIITLNEEKNIERCIRSLLPVADEIVVIDSGSTDHTAQICAKYGVSFIQKEWIGYGATKNFGHEKSSHEYILSIDADEELSPELQQNILKAKENLNGVYSLNRLTNYCGKWIRHSGWYPDKKIRLFPKSKVRWNLEEVHESLELQGLQEFFLQGDLYHYSYTSIFNHIDKSVHYGKLAGVNLFLSSKKPSWLKIIFSPWFRFIKDYFLRRGFMDGAYGFFIALTAAYSIFIKYFHHYQLHKEAHKK
jgi:glycosyltransferase involved in cell wall biosynthesis